MWEIRWSGASHLQDWGNGSSVTMCPKRNTQHSDTEEWRGLKEAKQSWRHSKGQGAGEG